MTRKGRQRNRAEGEVLKPTQPRPAANILCQSRALLDHTDQGFRPPFGFAPMQAAPGRTCPQTRPLWAAKADPGGARGCLLTMLSAGARVGGRGKAFLQGGSEVSSSVSVTCAEHSWQFLGQCPCVVKSQIVCLPQEMVSSPSPATVSGFAHFQHLAHNGHAVNPHKTSVSLPIQHQGLFRPL